jgi:hypothetical protein
MSDLFETSYLFYLLICLNPIYLGVFYFNKYSHADLLMFFVCLFIILVCKMLRRYRNLQLYYSRYIMNLLCYLFYIVLILFNLDIVNMKNNLFNVNNNTVQNKLHNKVINMNNNSFDINSKVCIDFGVNYDVNSLLEFSTKIIVCQFILFSISDFVGKCDAKDCSFKETCRCCWVHICCNYAISYAGAFSQFSL